MAGGMLLVVGVDGMVEGEVFRVPLGSQVVVGRSRSCDISLRKCLKYLSLDPEERARNKHFQTVSRQHLQISVERTYEQFIDLVARGRDMTPEAVDEVAQGRVWSGARALELGLVDDLGGIDSAIRLAAELATLDDFGIERLRPSVSVRDMLLGPLGNISSNLTEHPLWQEFTKAETLLRALDDPRANYAICEICVGPGRLTF